MSATAIGPQRLCPTCRAADPIRAGEPVWPMSWHCPACGRGLAVQSNIALLAPELIDSDTGFDLATFDRLARIEATHFWFVARNELIVALAARYFPTARRYLEVGCGNGAVLRAMAASRFWHILVGSDLHPAGLVRARQRLPSRVEFVQMDARAIPAVSAFDLIGAYDIVEHVADDDAVLRALRRATSPGGGAIIAVPQHPWLWSRSDEIGHHHRRYRVGELEAKLLRNGYEVMFSSSYTVVLLPLMGASRLLARARPQHADAAVSREISFSGRLNRALTGLLRLEVRLTVNGVRWPFGGSRVIVARAMT
jgi:SAM-dependent methyltransferase